MCSSFCVNPFCFQRTHSSLGLHIKESTNKHKLKRRHWFPCLCLCPLRAHCTVAIGIGRSFKILQYWAKIKHYRSTLPKKIQCQLFAGKWITLYFFYLLFSYSLNVWRWKQGQFQEFKSLFGLCIQAFVCPCIVTSRWENNKTMFPFRQAVGN